MDMAEWVSSVGVSLGAWGYLVVGLAAIVPWFELFAIIPGVLFLDLNPIGVAAVAIVANAAATLLLLWGGDRVVRWRRSRRGGGESKRDSRGRRVFDKYGVPGLMLQGPFFTGIYLAVIIALGFNAPRRNVAVWSVISILIWGVGLAAASVLGLLAFAAV